MFFTIITFIAAFLIEAIGTVVSVIGLSTLFGANPIIMTLAVALDIGKLVVVALLYKYWGELNRLMKSYGLIAAFVTMVITSAGAAGYLSGEFQKAIVGTQEMSLRVDLLKQEQTRLQERKQQIDQQIANLPANYGRTRVTVMREFEAEQSTITKRLTEIDRELPTLQVTQINAEAKAGPILYIAKAFEVSVEEAVKWVILLIIFVFDPLAVFLIVAGNFLLERHRASKAKPVAPLTGLAPPSAETVTKAQLDAYARAEQDDAAAARRSHESFYEILEPTASPPTASFAGATFDPPVETSTNEVKMYDRATVREGPTARTFTEEPEITKSTLGIVKPDESVRMLDTGEIGYGTGAYRTGFQPK